MPEKKVNDIAARQQLTPLQQNAIDLLISGKNVRKTAKLLGVHPNTVANWRLRNPAFQAVLDHRRNELWSNTLDRLRSVISVAVNYLDETFKKPDFDYPMRAANMLLRTLQSGCVAPKPSSDSKFLAPTAEEDVPLTQSGEPEPDRECITDFYPPCELNLAPAVLEQREHDPALIAEWRDRLGNPDIDFGSVEGIYKLFLEVLDSVQRSRKRPVDPDMNLDSTFVQQCRTKLANLDFGSDTPDELFELFLETVYEAKRARKDEEHVKSKQINAPTAL